MSRRPRRISFEGADVTNPSASGATIAGQKNRRKMNAPTAVNLASGNRFITAEDIWEFRLAHPRKYIWLRGKTYNATDFSEQDGDIWGRVANVIDEDFSDNSKLERIFLKFFW